MQGTGVFYDEDKCGKLNILKLTPSGPVGHYCTWTRSALHKLDDFYGTWHKTVSLIVAAISPHAMCSVQTLTESRKDQRSKEPFMYHATRLIAEF